MKYEEYNDYELMYLVSENEELAYNTIYQKYQPLIHKYASKYFFYAKDKGLEYQDVLQEGQVGLCNAIASFDETKSSFYTFTTICVEKQILKLLKKANSKKSSVLNTAILPESFSEELFYNLSVSHEILPNNIDDRDFENKIIDFKHSLDLTKASIFELRCNYFSYKEIAIILDITEKQVDNKLLSIRKSLKKYFKIQQ